MTIFKFRFETIRSNTKFCDFVHICIRVSFKKLRAVSKFNMPIFPCNEIGRYLVVIMLNSWHSTP